MTDDILKAATIGCGRMGATSSPVILEKTPQFWMPLTHLGAISDLPQLEAVACCDISEANRIHASETFGIPAHYDSYDELIASEKLDLLTVATRTPDKPDIILKAIKAGIRALHVEKPLCNSVSELLELEHNIARNDTLFSYGCMRRFLPPYLRARELVREQEAGTVRDIHIEMGNGPLMWAHAHAVEMLLFFADGATPVSVSALFDDLEFADGEAATIVNDPRILSATVVFDTGLVGRIGRTGGDAVTVSGDGFLVQLFADGAETYLSTVPPGEIYMKRTKVPQEASDAPGGTAAALNQLADAVLGDKQARSVVSDAAAAMLNSQHLIFDLLHSHMNGSKLIPFKSHSKDIKIMGLTDGRPA